MYHDVNFIQLEDVDKLVSCHSDVQMTGIVPHHQFPEGCLQSLWRVDDPSNPLAGKYVQSALQVDSHTPNDEQEVFKSQSVIELTEKLSELHATNQKLLNKLKAAKDEASVNLKSEHGRVVRLEKRVVDLSVEKEVSKIFQKRCIDQDREIADLKAALSIFDVLVLTLMTEDDASSSKPNANSKRKVSRKVNPKSKSTSSSELHSQSSGCSQSLSYTPQLGLDIMSKVRCIDYVAVYHLC